MKSPPPPPHVLEVTGGRLEAWGPSSELSVVGKPVPRRLAVEKVTGRARYASDVSLPGMLHGAILRSTVARGRVKSFDVSKALAMKGVRVIITAEDLEKMEDRPRTESQEFFPERPVLSREVRFVGAEIAVLAADSERIARDALDVIEVTYDELPPVLDMDRALDPEAPKLGEHGNLAGGEPEIVTRGDLAAGEKKATLTLERTYTTDAQFHHPLETHGCVAWWDRDSLVLHDSNQGVHSVRDAVSEALDVPMSHVRVISEFTGGGFGSKNGLKPHHVLASLLSRKTGRPVRLFNERREEFVASNRRARSKQEYRAGVDDDGRLTFLSQKVYGQGGPDEKLQRFVAGADCTEHLYAIPALRIELYRVMTNTQNVIPCRGPRTAENLFALEQFLDEIADAKGMDPLALRRVNHAELDPKDGKPYSSKGLLECYEKGAAAFGWEWKPAPKEPVRGKHRGVGMCSIVFHGVAGEQSQAMVVLQGDGTARVLAGISEIGVGATTILAQIAAEEIGMKVNDVVVNYGDSSQQPYSINSSYGSRTTALAGPAVRAAAHAVKRQLIERAAKKLGVDAATLGIRDGVVSARGGGDPLITVAELAKLAGRERITGIGNRHDPVETLEIQMFAAHFVEVEVDTDTGQVRVLRAVGAYDGGRWINPLMVESQIQGGFIQGMGMALYEEWVVDPRNGMQLNDSQHQYMIPTLADAPDSIQCLEVETIDASNSVNAKGLAEPPLIGAGPAIANAIHNAIGVRVRDYPMTPRRILDALRDVGKEGAR